MQVTETKTEGLARTYAAKAPASEIEALVDEKLEAVRGQAHLKGFRKGKAPTSLLKKLYGKNMLGEAMQELVDKTLRTHLEEQGHRPATQPSVKIVNEDFQEGDDLDVEFSYELLPEVPETDYSEIKLERLAVDVAEDSVQQALQRIAENAKSYSDKDGAAEAEDQVVIDFIGRIDGVAFDGGEAEDFPLVLGSGQFIPGFEDQLIGVTAGETKTVTVAFPAEYGAAELAGKDAEFEVTVKTVQAPQASAIDDELAQKHGAENLDALTQQVRDRIGDEYKSASRALLKRRLLDRLHEVVEFELPPSMVDQEARQIAHQLWHDENPDVQGHDHDPIEPTEEHLDLAKRRVKLGLLLADIGGKNKIEVAENELQNAILAQARQYPGREREFFEYVRNNPQMREQISAPIFEDKVIDYIFELSEISEKPVTADELSDELKKLEEED